MNIQLMLKSLNTDLPDIRADTAAPSGFSSAVFELASVDWRARNKRYFIVSSENSEAHIIDTDIT